MRIAFFITALAFIGACSSQQTRDPGSRYFDLPSGTTLVVAQAIAIPAGYAHTVLQGGKVIDPSALRRYEPFCELEVNDVLEREQQVEPDRFAVVQSTRQQQQVRAEPPTLLAGVGMGIGVGSGGRFGWSLGIGFPLGSNDRDSGGRLALNVITMRLQSSAQPQVRQLRCSAGWADLTAAQYPTLAEMNATLGNWASIKLP